MSTIKFRRGSTDSWKSQNPTLSDGQPGVEKTSGGGVRLKIGDGTNKWNTLSYTVGQPDETEPTGEIFNNYSDNVASGLASHAEGYINEASGNYSHAEGRNTKASGYASHTEGYYTSASGSYSHAEGYYTSALDNYCHSEGSNTESSIGYSHAEGCYSKASGMASHAEGYYTIASQRQHVCGCYNKSISGPFVANSSILIVGNGEDSTSRSNAFRVATAGTVYGSGAYNSSGADYAEMFEWLDQNISKEDRRGLFVTLDGDKIRLATSDDKYILGVVSGNPSVVGDSYFGDNWHGMYKVDVFGCPIKETVHVEEHTEIIAEEIKDENGNIISPAITETIPEHDEERQILNPDWNPDEEYLAREDRPEWCAVGLLGKLVVCDDGTCEVNSYCIPSENGIATKSDSGYRVLSRLDDTHIKILFR